MNGQMRKHRFVLQWHITERCNQTCSHCYQEAAAQAHAAWDLLLYCEEEFKKLIGYLHAQGFSDTAHLNITGGEPLLHPHLARLLERLNSEKRYSVGLLTNGTLIDAAWAKELRRLKVGFVQVSLDGLKETHNTIRGAGSFEQTVSGLRELVSQGITTLVSFTASRRNFREFPEVAKLGKRLGVSRVWCDRAVPLGGAREDYLRPDETKELLKLMRKASRRFWFSRTEVSLRRALQFCAGEGTPYRCTAGSSLLAIMPNADVYPCRRLPRVVGNLQKTPLEEIYRSAPLLQALRKNEVCEECACCYYSNLCRGGLRCLSDAVNGTPFRADPGCWMSSAVKQKAISQTPGLTTVTCEPLWKR